MESPVQKPPHTKPMPKMKGQETAASPARWRTLSSRKPTRTKLCNHEISKIRYAQESSIKTSLSVYQANVGKRGPAHDAVSFIAFDNLPRYRLHSQRLIFVAITTNLCVTVSPHESQTAAIHDIVYNSPWLRSAAKQGAGPRDNHNNNYHY